ncbi:MAG: hypothetical protein H7641_09185 [Candidatus Heimdallarchaeota archaeon]|nr:hypothetical protein [Candidatus Heimdallarchaeota archaeon]
MVFEGDKFKINWKEAQNSIARFLADNSFMVWEERSLYNKRVDILAKRTYRNKIFYLVFEVKHYNNVTASVEEKFRKQLEEYLKLLIKREVERKSDKQISNNYVFVGYLVLSKDYGIYLNRRKNWIKKQQFAKDSSLDKIWRRNTYLFCSTENYIQKNLEDIGLSFYSQSKLSDFF